MVRSSQMHRAFQNLADRLTESTDREAACQSMAEIATALNLSCFAYLVLPYEPGRSPNLISTYPPSWTAQYLRRKYESVDPVVRQAVLNDQPFRWGLGYGPPLRSDRERELFEEAARFGIRCGITFPIHDNKGAIAALTFASDQRPVDLERSMKEHAKALRLLAIFFHAHAKRMLTPDRVVDGVLLSPREFECLDWAYRGKSFGDIGMILGISRRSVAFHLDNVRAKFGVRSICQAVARLAESKSRR